MIRTGPLASAHEWLQWTVFEALVQLNGPPRRRLMGRSRSDDLKIDAVPATSLTTRRLLSNDFVVVDVDYARRIVLLRRSANVFRRPADVDRTIVD